MVCFGGKTSQLACPVGRPCAHRKPKPSSTEMLAFIIHPQDAGRQPFQWKRAWGQMKGNAGDFPGSPVVKTSPSNAGGAGSIPGQGAKIPHASWPKNQKHKTEAILYKFNKDFLKNGPHQKKKVFKKKKELLYVWSQTPGFESPTPYLEQVP